MARAQTAVKDAPLLDLKVETPAGKPPAKMKPHGKSRRQPSTAVSTAVRKPEPPAPKTMLQVIYEATTNPLVDVAKMEALLKMQERIAAEEARIAFIESFLALKQVLPKIDKNGKIVIPPKDNKKGQTTLYATYDAITDVTDPILFKYGFVYSSTTEPSADGTRLNIVGHLDHVRGFGRMTTFPLPAETSGSKNNVQGWGSSFSYGKRYCKIALLDIQTRAPQDRDTDGVIVENAIVVETADRKTGRIVDDDFPGDRVETVKGKKLDDLVDHIQACGVKQADFCKKYGIAKVADLPTSRLAEAIQALTDHANHNRRT